MTGIVRALYERPTQLRRYPDGAEGEAIYQKRVPKQRPEWVETARVTFPSGRHADELCVTELAQVAWAANLGTIDFHPWPSRRARHRASRRASDRRRPAAGNDVRGRKRVAAVVREALEEIGYVGWPKTSGNRGIHVYCRIEPNWGFRVVRRAALAFAREIERRLPKRGHDRLVEGGAWRERLHRLQPERPGPDDRLGLLGARAARRDGVRAGHLGRAPGRRDGGLHDGDHAGALRRLGDVQARDRRRRLRPAACCSSGSSATRRRASGRRRTRRTSRRCRTSRRASSRRARRTADGLALAAEQSPRGSDRPRSGRGRSSRPCTARGSCRTKADSRVPCRKRLPCNLS